MEALISLVFCGGLVCLFAVLIFLAWRSNNQALAALTPTPLTTAQVSMRDIDRMTGTMFERCLADLFARQGYHVEHTGRLGDYGADLVVTRDNQRSVVQAKRWTRQVGVRAVQEAVAAKGIYHCTHAMVVTNSSFTHQARRLAQANSVELWDRRQLMRLLQTTPAPPAPQLPPTTPSVDPTAFVVKPIAPAAPIVACCDRCGTPVSEKVRQYCLDHAQRFNGAILCYQHQRPQVPRY